MEFQWKSYSLRLVAALLVTAAMLLLIEERSAASVLKEFACETDAFRKQILKPEVYEKICRQSEKGADFSEVLTVTMLRGNFSPKEVSLDKNPFVKYKPREFQCLKEAYRAVWADVICFPIPDRNISFENTFGDPREYGGERRHEGTDLFGKTGKAGYYPIISMTDGVVECIGWLPLGGYRIGIRAPGGGYFYYAHLSGYERDFQEGESVEAGEILGYMGDTGYGPVGTRGKFPVHLHLGIYIKTPHHEELSVNPYYVLCANSKNFRNYSY